MTEQETLAKYSTPSLQRNILSRQAKKLNMEFDSNYAHMTRAERDAFLDALYPEEVKPKKEDSDERPIADVRPPDPARGTSGAEEAPPAPDKEEAGQGEARADARTEA